MTSKINKVDYVAVPCEEPKQEPNYNKENLIYPDGTNLSYAHCQYHKRNSWKLWKNTLIMFMLIFLGSRALFSGISYYYENNLPDDAYPCGPIPHHAHHGFFGAPNEPVCNPTFKWNGPSELLIDPREISGLIFNVKGMSAFGGVTIRQDSEAEFLTIENKIYLSEESLQNEVDIKIDIIDEDYSITIETPSFDGPRPTTKCVHIDTIITFPKGIDFWRSLAIDVPNGIITTENLKKVEFAYVNFKTRNGNIKTNLLNSAISEIATINGHVQGSILTGEALDVRTVNGAVSIDTLINELADHVGIAVKSINGHLDVAVPRLKDAQSIDFKAGSVNGGVTVNMPDTFVGNFSATCLIGFAYIEGQNLIFTKNLRNAKVGYKNSNDNNDSDTRHHKNKLHQLYQDEFSSNIVIEAVTGAVELYFE